MGGNCGACSACRHGDLVNCTNQPITGASTDGGYAEVAIARAAALVAVPAGLDPAEAAPLLCAGLTTFNALRGSGARLATIETWPLDKAPDAYAATIRNEARYRNVIIIVIVIVI
jgi:NADPH:quinone reductase-like Zn-dependent oxidoreductase